MANYLWRDVSEEEKQEIKEQSKKLMGSFSKKLAKLGDSFGDSSIDRDEYEREEGKGKCEDIDREIMFENAPKKNKDFIIAEKKKW